MEPLTLNEVAQGCAGRLVRGGAETRVCRVTTDSRRTQAGDLFVALRGDRFDGHAFVGDAARGGAAGIVAEPERLPAPLPEFPLVAVGDTRRALGELASWYRRRFALPVVAVAGSNGKTTTKELLAAVLGRRLLTLASEASFNNDIGVPLTLLRLERSHAAAVLEAGTNHPGELAPLLAMIRPRYGVLTGLGREHLEHFGDFAGVVAEEGGLAEALPRDGRLFINGDSPGIESLVARSRATVVRVGFGPGNDWRAADCRLDETGTTFTVVAERADFNGEFRLRLLGRHQVINALLALAVGAELGLGPGDIRAGLAGCPPVPLRLELTEIAGLRVLMDCYNANADSTLAALAVLRDLPCAGRRLAVLSDMSELGAHTGAAHAEIGQALVRHGVQGLFAVGAMAEVLVAAARGTGLGEAGAFPDVPAVAVALRGSARPGDLVLIKASRAARLERLLDALRPGGAGTD
ncbi:MAG: UDP-N-acetylmuramoyl-tripeptide--D-alanyl-D-alanine ligase [Verrucomicrobiota bacterium]|jgi:UDP-N-acetylmuramoyl-tripeptide--D-alanyl-D-alanine ligase